MNTEEMKLIENLTLQYSGRGASNERIIGHTVAQRNIKTNKKEDLEKN
jgi:hypothetical protein